METIRRVIEPQIKGLSIEQVAVRRSEVVAHPTADEFCRCLAGQVVDRMARRGKFLIIWLESGDKVVIHLRMTGCLLVTLATCAHRTMGGWQFGARYLVDLFPWVILWFCARPAWQPRAGAWTLCGMAMLFNLYGAVYMLQTA